MHGSDFLDGKVLIKIAQRAVKNCPSAFREEALSAILIKLVRINKAEKIRHTATPTAFAARVATRAYIDFLRGRNRAKCTYDRLPYQDPKTAYADTKLLEDINLECIVDSLDVSEECRKLIRLRLIGYGTRVTQRKFKIHYKDQKRLLEEAKEHLSYLLGGVS